MCIPGDAFFYVATSFNDSHTKPTISRAQATLTLLGCLPAINRRLPFLFNRLKQRSAMLINSGEVSFRLAFKSPEILAVRYPRWLASTNAVRKYRLPCLVIPKRLCLAPGRILPNIHSNPGSQLPRVGKTLHVSDFANHGECKEILDPFVTG